MNEPRLSRRRFLLALAAAVAAGLPRQARASLGPLLGGDDRTRLAEWVRVLRREGLTRREVPLRRAAIRVGELALGSPYVAGLLDAYAAAGGDPSREPLTLDLSRFDCVLLVEGCLAVAGAARSGDGGWDAFAREVERIRYRGGARSGYGSRLHYFSDWIADNASRGLLRDLGRSLGGVPDRRPLRFMSTHRGSYPALRDDRAYAEIVAMERRLDARPRWVIPTDRIGRVQARIHSGDVLAFATRIDGLDATHTGLAYRHRGGVLHVLHAPLAGGVVEISRRTLPEYVAALRSATGIMVARPL